MSYLEWVQNIEGEQWEEDVVNKKLRDYLVPATEEMYTRARADGTSLKDAAFAIAIERLVNA